MKHENKLGGKRISRTRRIYYGSFVVLLVLLNVLRWGELNLAVKAWSLILITYLVFAAMKGVSLDHISRISEAQQRAKSELTQLNIGRDYEIKAEDALARKAGAKGGVEPSVPGSGSPPTNA